MSGEWKPGDVAMVTREDGATTVALWTRYGYGWQCVEGGAPITDARPLVVIDPEDREQVERVAAACRTAFGWTSGPSENDTTITQAALRSLVTPPKPDGPTGLGAVVEDAAGDVWVHDRDANPGYLGVEWLNVRTRSHLRYASIAAVKVLSEGVQP